MACVSSRSIKCAKKIDNTSDEDELNSSEGDESSGLGDLSSNHKEKSTLKSLTKTSLAVDSSDESDDGRKFSSYPAKLPAERRSQNHYNYYLPDGKGIKRKKRAETDVSFPSYIVHSFFFKNQIFILLRFLTGVEHVIEDLETCIQLPERFKFI